MSSPQSWPTPGSATFSWETINTKVELPSLQSAYDAIKVLHVFICDDRNCTKLFATALLCKPEVTTPTVVLVGHVGVL